MRTQAASQNQRDHTAVVIVHTFVVSFTIEPVCTHFTYTQLMSFVASANRLYIRYARSAGTPLCRLQSPGGADVPTVYSR